MEDINPEQKAEEIQAETINERTELVDPFTTKSGREIKKKQDPQFLYYTDKICYTDGVITKELDWQMCSNLIQKLDDTTQYSFYVEALQWFDYTQRDIADMMYKAKQWSVQQGVDKFGHLEEESVMKEIQNLTVKNDCFGEVDFKSLTQEMKDKALPILMFMVMKRNGDLKTRGCVNGSVQKLYMNKEDVSSPTPDFYAFKYICAVIAREGRDVASVDLPGFFLQTKQDDETLLLRLTGSVALYLVKSDPKRWRKHLVKERDKFVIYVRCKKAIYGTMNAAIFAYKKLVKLFRDWGFVMNPCDTCSSLGGYSIC